MADEDTPTQPDDMKYEEFGYADLMQRRETVARFLRDIPNQPLTLAAVTLVVIEANQGDVGLVMQNLRSMYAAYLKIQAINARATGSLN
jgi:hypothetical protein